MACAEETFAVTEKGAALRAAQEGRFDALPIYDRAIECASREDIEALQLEKLKNQVAYTYERVPWYRQKMDEMGVAPEDIETLDDVRKLPFTDKTALRDTFPFGLFAVPLSEVRELHSSSGTTGKPVVVGYTPDDLNVWSDCIARLVQMAGVVPGDVAKMAFGYGMFTGGFGLHYGLQKLGCAMIPAGSGNTERHIQMIEDYGTTVLVATPSYAMHICEVGEQMGYDWASSPLRVGLFGGEPCPPGLKAEIERRMHITCTDNYGLTEVMGPGVSGECLAERFQQHIAEDHFLWEVVDPETGEPVAEGEMGELVLTPLDKQAIPVLRYRTHDLTRVHTEPCACGRTHARMDKVRSRSDDMLIIRGTNVFPSQIEDVLSGIDEVTPHYHIIVDTKNGMDVFTVETELRPEAFSDSFESMNVIKENIAEKLKSTLLVAPAVRLVEPGGIERAVGKAKHVDDRRKK
ncbi:phenylacetate--CoA ligase family protein [uncultured Adlercreutzia sp.]|uniref:phenylacetate--CoA ligase family protein n=1 Tax=uncultured Adlercreutzia sp. TaxID=875803 RepID=UPI0026F3BD6E|nr:phenylacetate--CoA ligase [uncultured Adlercreutzia sp.]